MLFQASLSIVYPVVSAREANQTLQYQGDGKNLLVLPVFLLRCVSRVYHF